MALYVSSSFFNPYPGWLLFKLLYEKSILFNLTEYVYDMHIIHCDITYILLETLYWCWLHAYLTDTKTWISTVYFIIVVGSVPTNQIYFLILLLIFQEFSALDCVHRGIIFQSCNCFSNWYSFRSGRQLNDFLGRFRA